MFDRDHPVKADDIFYEFTGLSQLKNFRQPLKLTPVVNEYSGSTFNISSWTGTAYIEETPQKVIEILDRLLAARSHFYNGGFRVRLWYGSPKTGEAWGDVETGRIGRSSGTFKIPLIINNNRCYGGPAIGSAVVRIDRADLVRGERWVLYQHPDFHLSPDADEFVLAKAN